MTTVINIKDAPEGWMHDSKYVYIGRAGAGFAGTWGNPYVLRFEKHRDKILELYTWWLSRQDAEYLAKMDSLWGKTLVCFCKPKACHGDVIVDYVDRKLNESYDWDSKLERS